MRFANPEYLYLLLLLPVIIGLFIYSNYRRRKNIDSYGDPQLLKKLIPSTATLRNRIGFWFTFFAFALMVVVLARPQFGSKKETVTTRGIEVVVALDISNSMLADDISPNRLEKAKPIPSIRLLSKGHSSTP